MVWAIWLHSVVHFSFVFKSPLLLRSTNFTYSCLEAPGIAVRFLFFSAWSWVCRNFLLKQCICLLHLLNMLTKISLPFLCWFEVFAWYTFVIRICKMIVRLHGNNWSESWILKSISLIYGGKIIKFLRMHKFSVMPEIFQ